MILPFNNDYAISSSSFTGYFLNTLLSFVAYIDVFTTEY